LEDTAKETRKTTRQTTRNVPTEEQIDRPTETRKSSGSGSSSDGRAMLQKALDLLAESRRETKRLQEALKEQMEMTRELKEAVAKQEETTSLLSVPFSLKEEIRRCPLAHTPASSSFTEKGTVFSVPRPFFD
jgi:seryl-tRNA synthetase